SRDTSCSLAEGPRTQWQSRGSHPVATTNLQLPPLLRAREGIGQDLPRRSLGGLNFEKEFYDHALYSLHARPSQAHGIRTVRKDLARGGSALRRRTDRVLCADQDCRAYECRVCADPVSQPCGLRAVPREPDERPGGNGECEEGGGVGDDPSGGEVVCQASSLDRPGSGPRQIVTILGPGPPVSLTCAASSAEHTIEG